jgi:hypothetical protein
VPQFTQDIRALLAMLILSAAFTFGFVNSTELVPKRSKC